MINNPIRRTLAFKLILAFWLVSLTVAGLAWAISRWTTVSEFHQLVVDQAQNRFITAVAGYYQARGTWDGIMEYMHISPLPPLPLPYPANPHTPPGQTPIAFALADMQGFVVLPAGQYRLGDHLALSDLKKNTAIEINGQVVGYALATGKLPALDQREQSYLQRTDQALFLASLGATVFALFLGILLARTLTHPLQDLTAAIRGVTKGELNQQVPVRSNDELGELVASFNQMSAELAQANLLRRQMTADIAHDLRTPLTVIGGYLEALRDGILKPNSERYEVIYKEVQHLQRLVEDLRTLSLADAGELSLNRQPIAPQALLERLSSAYQHRAEVQGIDLLVQAAPDLPAISVDVERMVQVLSNLVSNALRYTPNGGRITLSAERQDEVVLLKVKDTGEGIPAEALPRLFNRFYRADASRQQAEGESGLGLAIARSIVEAQGGKIAVESALGQGSVFTITLLASP